MTDKCSHPDVTLDGDCIIIPVHKTRKNGFVYIVCNNCGKQFDAKITTKLVGRHNPNVV